VSIGGVDGTQLDAASSSLPSTYPPECPVPCISLFDLGYGYQNFYPFLEGYKYRVVMLRVEGKLVVIILESPAEDFDEFEFKATAVLRTVEWGG